MTPIKRALISVSDKTGIVELGRALHNRGVELLSTGGTQKALEDAGLPVTAVSDYTGFPEMMDGRVKTLHPKIHGGLLALRDEPEHMTVAAEHGIGMIDLVVVNLYPFQQTVSKPDVTVEEAIENIDIGGPSMLRSAAKNQSSVTVVVDPADYAVVLDEMGAHDGAVTDSTRRRLSQKVFAYTAAYDGAIAGYFAGISENGERFPQRLTASFDKVDDLRYGENPHQAAAFYADPTSREAGFATAEVIAGKPLSYNNYMDLDAALALVREFTEPAACVIKHTNPCGAGTGDAIGEAYARALEGDPMSAFGSVQGFNREVDAGLAQAIAQPKTFVEAIVAPGFSPEAVDILQSTCWWGKDVRLVAVGDLDAPRDPMPNMRRVAGGLLVQDFDTPPIGALQLEQVTERAITDAERAALLFAWTIVKHVKSNAIVFAQGQTLVGTGAGQMSRVDSSEIAAKKAGDRAQGAVLASDAFFPFRDGIDAAAAAGVTAIIQPGGSKGDEDVIAAANEHGIAMVFTGMRHFRH